MLSQRDDLVPKHKELLNKFKWCDKSDTDPDLCQAHPCDINRGVLDNLGNISVLEANIYVDDILVAAAFKEYMLRLLAAIIEAIFLVCGVPDIAVRQCPLLQEKWFELIVFPRRIILGLIVNTIKMTVGIPNKYVQQICNLLMAWDPDQRLFKVSDMQKLLGKKPACLGEGAPWTYKLMSHLYTSLAFALKSYTKLLKKSSSGSHELVKHISTTKFSGRQSDHQHCINFTMKKAAKMINRYSHLYLVNQTMQDELTFLPQALLPESGIRFETPVAHLIPRIPTASIIGNSSLIACGGYSITLKFWWHLSFPKEIVKRTLLHLKDNSDEIFILINCLEYMTISTNYCTSLVAFESRKQSTPIGIVCHR
jgi:hypothetical protein